MRPITVAEAIARLADESDEVAYATATAITSESENLSGQHSFRFSDHSGAVFYVNESLPADTCRWELFSISITLDRHGADSCNITSTWEAPALFPNAASQRHNAKPLGDLA